MRAETVLARSAVTVKPVEARFDVLEDRKQLSDVLWVVELTRISVTAQIAAQEQAHQGQAIAGEVEAVVFHRLACRIGQRGSVAGWDALLGRASNGHAGPVLGGAVQELASGLEIGTGQVLVPADAEVVLELGPDRLVRQACVVPALIDQRFELPYLLGGDEARSRRRLE